MELFKDPNFELRSANLTIPPRPREEERLRSTASPAWKSSNWPPKVPMPHHRDWSMHKAKMPVDPVPDRAFRRGSAGWKPRFG